jgi:hypothetical protein
VKLTASAIRLVRQAVKKKLLAFRKKPKDRWLKPKVYKGKSMHEEELEQ